MGFSYVDTSLGKPEEPGSVLCLNPNPRECEAHNLIKEPNMSLLTPLIFLQFAVSIINLAIQLASIELIVFRKNSKKVSFLMFVKLDCIRVT